MQNFALGYSSSLFLNLSFSRHTTATLVHSFSSWARDFNTTYPAFIIIRYLPTYDNQKRAARGSDSERGIKDEESDTLDSNQPHHRAIAPLCRYLTCRMLICYGLIISAAFHLMVKKVSRNAEFFMNA